MKLYFVLILVAALLCVLPAAHAEPMPEVFESGDFEYTLVGDSAQITGYTGYAKTLNIPAALGGKPVTEIGEWAFAYFESLSELVIPEGIEVIGEGAFADCTGLTELVIPESVTSIGPRAFSYCYGLTSIVIPESVTSIGIGAFSGTAIAAIEVSLNNPSYAQIDGVLFNKQGNTLHAYPPGRTDAEYAVPAGTTGIGESAFANCSNLTSIVIHEGIETIGAEAFAGTAIEVITVPLNNLNYAIIDGVLFDKKANALHTYPPGRTETEYAVPAGTTAIGKGAFEFCLHLTSVVIPESVTSIGGGAFYACTNLTEVVIPESVTSIGEGAFAYCYELPSIVIPESVTSIGGWAFLSCAALTEVVIPEGVTSIADSAFAFCFELQSVVIPESVTSIGIEAFEGCDSLSIEAKEGSFAHQYAVDNDIPFTAMLG